MSRALAALLCCVSSWAGRAAAERWSLAAPSDVGPFESYPLGVDEIRAVPEPGVAALVTIALGALAARKR